jgi:hypothetical protein
MNILQAQERQIAQWGGVTDPSNTPMNYSTVYSWMLGAEVRCLPPNHCKTPATALIIQKSLRRLRCMTSCVTLKVNDPFYSGYPTTYALWGFVRRAVFFPSPLQPANQAIALEHLAAYTRGAAGIQ